MIQHVSGGLGFNGPPKSVVISLAKNTANNGVSPFLVPVGAGVFANSFFSAFDQPVVFYIDPAGKPTVVASAPNSVISNTQVTLTGYLLDCTVNTCAAIAP